MNRPEFPQGSLTAEDARFIRQDDAMPAREIKSVAPNYYRDMLAAKNARMARKAKVQEGLIVTVGGAVLAVLGLVVGPVIMAGYSL